MDPVVDINIFNGLLEKRPEISPPGLKKDLDSYYLPFAKKLIALKEQKKSAAGVLVGVSAIQGAGKTTQGEVMEILLGQLGHKTCSLSIDDHYITHRELVDLRRDDSRYIRRGVTHDIALAIRDLKKLQTMKNDDPIMVSGYDKGIQSGDGDRLRWINPQPNLTVKAKVVQEELVVNKEKQHVQALQIVSAAFGGKNIILLDNMGSDLPIFEHFLPLSLIQFLVIQTGEIVITMRDDGMVNFAGLGQINVAARDLPNGWKVISKKPDFIFYDGWMLGARSVTDETVFSSALPALESAEAQDFAKMINKKLLDYEKLWQMFEFLNLLYVPNYQVSVSWRDQAEELLRQKGEGMSPEEISEFVHYFWRSVHPAIHIKNLAHDSKHTNQVVIINDDHSIAEILTPAEAKTKYF